jgi:hypothetical protein
MAYHHKRSSLYYGVGTLESFLNTKMRSHLEGSSSEEEIFKKLRTVRIDEKIATWPSEICRKEIKLENDFIELFETYKRIRDEVTHPKKVDHGIYVELDQLNPDLLAKNVSRYMVAIFEGENAAYPYWLLGWNYVGMGGNAAHPLQSNNLNGFWWSLKNMNFLVPSNDPTGQKFESKYMKSLAGFEVLKSSLDQYPLDIEPFVSVFPFKPRLTKRWWDVKFIEENTPKLSAGAPL